MKMEIEAWATIALGNDQIALLETQEGLSPIGGKINEVKFPKLDSLQSALINAATEKLTRSFSQLNMTLISLDQRFIMPPRYCDGMILIGAVVPFIFLENFKSAGLTKISLMDLSNSDPALMNRLIPEGYIRELTRLTALFARLM